MLIKTRLVEKPDAKPRSGGFIIINLKLIFVLCAKQRNSGKTPLSLQPRSQLTLLNSHPP